MHDNDVAGLRTAAAGPRDHSPAARRPRQGPRALVGRALRGRSLPFATAGLLLGATLTAVVGSAGPSAATTHPAHSAATAHPTHRAVTARVTHPAGTALPAPAGDAFYTPPSPLPAGRPGDVIWARQLASINGISGATGYQVMYLSTNALGRADAVTGTIIVPNGRTPATMPIVGYAVGTQGLGDTCAPSRQLAQGIEYEVVGINNVLSKGYAVAITDYEGLGTPGVHTYVVGRSEGPAVIDSVRAAQRLGATGLGTGNAVGFMGYSQGGGAAAWAGELQPRYAPELRLVGIAAGGVPADLIAVEKNLDGYVGAGFGYMAALGLDAAYPELGLRRYLNARGVSALGAAVNQCVGEVAATYAFSHIADFTTTNPLVSPAWVARLNQNKLGSMPPRVPILLYGGSNDEIVGFDQQRTLVQTYCAARAPVSWKIYFGEHVSTFAAALGDATDFLSARFAGIPVRSNC